MFKRSKGFTMIELLIVIAVLGVLAVAVLSAINPIEQINRGKDTGSRSDSEQLINAIDRYYTTQNIYPWQVDQDSDEIQAWYIVNNTWVDAGGSSTVLSKLAEGAAGTGEIKASFVSRITATGYNFLYAYNAGTQGSSTYVCFNPKSASFKKEAQTRCTATGGLPSDYPPVASSCPGGTPAVYYSCLP